MPQRQPTPEGDPLELLACYDCGAVSFRRRHPALGVPVRCGACEARETARLRGLGGRGRG